VRTVALVGPESTGKTTLAARLAAAFDAEWSPESARAYAQARRAAGGGRPLGAEDVPPIARGQMALEDAAAERARAAGRRLVVRDTDLVSTVAYARHYYGAAPAWVDAAARARRADLYLLCDVDAPWAPDAVRDPDAAGAAARRVVRDAFVATLGEFGCAYAWVRGGWAERERAAGEAVRALLGARDGAR
jgi:NadR type nicotinamide-nucleotide adenylyltransferase